MTLMYKNKYFTTHAALMLSIENADRRARGVPTCGWPIYAFVQPDGIVSSVTDVADTSLESEVTRIELTRDQLSEGKRLLHMLGCETADVEADILERRADSRVEEVAFAETVLHPSTFETDGGEITSLREHYSESMVDAPDPSSIEETVGYDSADELFAALEDEIKKSDPVEPEESDPVEPEESDPVEPEEAVEPVDSNDLNKSIDAAIAAVLKSL